MEFFLVYPLLGIFSGVLAGLLGIGGGLIIVPALLYLLPYQNIPPDRIAHVAVGTSLAAVFLTAASSSYAHHKRGGVDWRVARMLAPGLITGALLGAALAGVLPGRILQICYSVFAILAAIQMIRHVQPPPSRSLPGWPGMTGAGSLIGFISAVVGIGGGTMTVPFLRAGNVSIKTAIGTSAACGLPLAAAGVLGFALAGAGGADALPAGLAGHVYWPGAAGIGLASVLAAPMGAALAHRVSTRLLNKIFAILLVLVALHLMFPS